jgi:hypothetical protein
MRRLAMMTVIAGKGVAGNLRKNLFCLLQQAPQ